MAEVSGNPDRTRTVVVDLPLLPCAGVLIATAGLVARCFAHWLAWPVEWKYIGDRANTVWAYRESLYADLGLVALAFGLSLVWLSIARGRPQRQAEPRS